MKTLSGIILFLVILVLAYTGFWFYQAHHVKELVVYHLNEYAKPDSEGYQFKVADVSVGGYPFHYVVKLTNPQYAKAPAAKESPQSSKVALDGDLKIGTDVLGKSYWIKHEGDLNYILAPEKGDQAPKRYVVKGNLEFKVDVANPQYAKAFMHPFFGLPKVFYKENPSFQELINEVKMASYEDHNFGLYEVDANNMKQLFSFSKGWARWMHNPEGKEDEKFIFNIDFKDLEAAENGRALLPHLKKLMALSTDMAVDVPYMLGSGKNSLSLDFEALLPRQFDPAKFFSYKNIDIALKKFQMDNLYGRSLANIGFTLKEKENDSRNLHLGFNAESLISDKGSEAIHRQFIESLKLKVAEQPADPESKVVADLLKCCEERLQDIIPDYTKLGKMQFIFDTDVIFRDVSKAAVLDGITVTHLDVLAQPYGIRTFGKASFENEQPSGKYEIRWTHYKEMIHDLVSYYNRVYPIFEKFAEVNKQPLAIGFINASQEKEIIDFFKSISNEPTKEVSDLSITIDFMDINNPKIGGNSLEQVKQAWHRLVSDIEKKEIPAKPAPSAAQPVKKAA
jgi:hypothetical protein